MTSTPIVASRLVLRDLAVVAASLRKPLLSDAPRAAYAVSFFTGRCSALYAAQRHHACRSDPGAPMFETVFIVLFVLLVVRMIYRSGKREGSRKGFHVGIRRGRRRR